MKLKIKKWFKAWILKDDSCIGDVFSKNIVYRESYGPVYNGIDQIYAWFHKWNTEGAVLEWSINDVIHNETTTAVSWKFVCHMNCKDHDSSFDGMSLIRWDHEDKIIELTEYACK